MTLFPKEKRRYLVATPPKPPVESIYFSLVFLLLILIFIDNWNIVDQAVIFLREPYQQPLSVYLCQILEEQPDIFYAASVFYAVPVLLIFLMGQDYLIQGISMSGVKA